MRVFTMIHIKISFNTKFNYYLIIDLLLDFEPDQ